MKTVLLMVIMNIVYSVFTSIRLNGRNKPKGSYVSLYF